MELMSKIRNYVKKWRAEHRLTREGAAMRLYANAETIRKWEIGQNDPSYQFIKVIHDNTGAKWEDLF